MALDSFVIAGLAHELNSRLENARVDRVTMPRRDRVILHLRSREGNVRLLLCAGNGARVHLTGEKFENPETPPMFCMLLRKQLSGGRLVSVTQPDHERLLELRFSATDELGVAGERRLVCEMMGRMTNLILIGPEGHILACTHPVDPDSSSRAVQPGLIYRLPPKQEKPSLWQVSPEALEEVCRQAAGDSGRLCGGLAGLSPLMAREAVFRGKSAAGTTRALLELREAQPVPWMLRREGGKPDFAAVKITGEPNTECIRFDNFSELLDEFYREQTRANDLKNLSGGMERTMTTVKNRLVRKLAGQRQELQDACQRERLKRTADLITANLYAIRPGDKQVTLTDYFDPDLPQVSVTLDPQLPPQENAQRLFSKYTRLKRAEEALTRQIALGEEELAYVEAVLYTLSAAPDAEQIREIREELIQAGYVKPAEKGRRKPKPLRYDPRSFAVEGGFTVLCGRNNRENDELTHRRAGKNDLWFHARGVPGCHAVLLTQGREPGEQAIRQAAAIAAYFSGAKSQPRAAVDYTQIRRVKKPQGAGAGMVNYFSYQTALVEPGLPQSDS